MRRAAAWKRHGFPTRGVMGEMEHTKGNKYEVLFAHSCTPMPPNGGVMLVSERDVDLVRLRCGILMARPAEHAVVHTFARRETGD